MVIILVNKTFLAASLASLNSPATFCWSTALGKFLDLRAPPTSNPRFLYHGRPYEGRDGIKYLMSSKLKGNKVRNPNTAVPRKMANHASRWALTAKLATRHGLASRLVCFFVSIVPTCIVIWACIPRLFGTPLLRCLKVRFAASEHLSTSSTAGNLHSCAP
jgi:hypothetical protein